MSFIWDTLIDCKKQIIKEFDKDMASKAKTYIKSYSKIEDSIMSVTYTHQTQPTMYSV